MAEKLLSLQDHFLNSARRAKSPVTIFLIKGVKLSGVITWFDAFSLLLRRDGKTQLLYKHAISTIMPTAAVLEFVHWPEEGLAGPKSALQDVFLAAAVREQENMTLYLVNGVMLQGRVAGFDQFSLVLEQGGQLQLVYKHAISTLQPDQPLDLGGGGSPVEPTGISTEGSTGETISESEA